MSNRLFQGVLLQIKEATGRTVGVVDADGEIIACSDTLRVGKVVEDDISSDINDAGGRALVSGGSTYCALANWGATYEYAVFVEGEDREGGELCALAAITLGVAKTAYDEKHDKATFIKNIILDNILPGDIHVRARELHVDEAPPHVVFLIRQVDKTDIAALDILHSLFPDKQHDVVLNLSETDLALVKEVRGNVDPLELKKVAYAIEETINSELYIKTVIGIGSVAENVKELARSYKEAQIAIDVGKVFDTDKTVVSYETLGLGRLIYQLPTTMCQMFMSEVFKKGSLEGLDQETLFTILKFFENSLNVSETSRKLFVHRNTLVYRLEKIKKITGLDLREFDHAIVFKVALMVRRYLTAREEEMKN